ncbi:hypothetical protein DH2020_043295 [Rehmannia glutinosa]|uniref:Beta-amylase n=1 Tax=Rehmannia glutinosa TaxID=99300 RepID=A0ABR0UKJ0_REHGL
MQNDGVKLFVGMPLDTVSKSNTINHARAISAGLKALKLLGVDGVELPVWWGIAENEIMGKYEWTAYLAVVEMVQKLGLKLHVSLCFHASQECKIPLPEWVSRNGEVDPNIYFMDRLGQQYKDCLSLAVDDVPVLDGKTPVDVYKEFCENFKSAFSPFLGSTITGISIGLGPDGELRYPSHHGRVKSNYHGAGEFQCYDKNMLSNLKQHAEKHGNPLWGLGGPHDAPAYDNCPISGGFFMENGGSWETPYGDFFLSWYSNQLISHGDRILSLAASAFKDASITGLKRIRKNLMDENAVADLFMYQRMGAYFFSPEHFSLFAQFVRGLNQPIQSLDDLTVEKGDDIESIPGSSLHMQTA